MIQLLKRQFGGLFFLLLSCVIVAHSQAQTICDSLIIGPVQFATFNDSLIAVQVDNQSATLFSYPGFVLLNMNGDTLAKEVVDYFGIGGNQVHLLKRYYTTPLANTTGFNVQLHLWTGFYQQQACSWTTTLNACPPGACSPLVVSMTNAGSALVTDTIEWQIFNATNQLVANGAFEFTPTNQNQTASLCLGAGSFLLAIESPLTTGGQLFYSIGDNGHFQSNVQGNYQQGAPVNELIFDHFGLCSGLSNGFTEPKEIALFSLRQELGSMFIQLENINEAAILSITNTQGKLAMQRRLITNSVRIELQELPKGAYWVSLHQGNKQQTKKFMR